MTVNSLAIAPSPASSLLESLAQSNQELQRAKNIIIEVINSNHYFQLRCNSGGCVGFNNFSGYDRLFGEYSVKYFHIDNSITALPQKDRGPFYDICQVQRDQCIRFRLLSDGNLVYAR